MGKRKINCRKNWCPPPLLPSFLGISLTVEAGEGGSSENSVYRSLRGAGFSFQHLHGGSWPPVTPVSGDLMFSLDLSDTAHMWCRETDSGTPRFTQKSGFISKSLKYLVPLTQNLEVAWEVTTW